MASARPFVAGTLYVRLRRVGAACVACGAVVFLGGALVWWWGLEGGTKFETFRYLGVGAATLWWSAIAFLLAATAAMVVELFRQAHEHRGEAEA